MHMKKKEVAINTEEELNGTVSKINERIQELENKIDCQEQYSRRNCILIHGITKN